jgi:hypothetical protein
MIEGSGIRIRKAQKHMDPTDPDPQYSQQELFGVLYRAAAQSVMDCLQHYESLPARTETPEQAAALTQPTQVV